MASYSDQPGWYDICSNATDDALTLRENFFNSLDRLDVPSQVLDPRLNRIAVGKNTGFHRHAHDAVMHLPEGEANVLIKELTLSLKKGDTVLVPRWCDHQTFHRHPGAEISGGNRL